MPSVGRITQVIGPAVDVEFPDGDLPAIFNAVSDALSPLGITPTHQPLGPSEIVDLLMESEGLTGDRGRTPAPR